MAMALRVLEGAVNEAEPIKEGDVSKFVHGLDRMHKKK